MMRWAENLLSYWSRLYRWGTRRNVIRKKLLVYFLISAVLVNSICLYTYNNTSTLIARLNRIFLNDITLTNLGNSVETVEVSLRGYLTTSHSEDLEKYLSSSHKLENQTAALPARLTDDKGTLLLADIKGMVATYLQQAQTAEIAKRGRDINAYSQSFNEASRIYDYIIDTINELKIYEFQQNNAHYVQLDRWLGLLQTFNIVVILVSMVVNILLIFWFAYRLTEPILRLSKAAGSIADGDFSVPDVVVETHDELHTLALAFNRMAGNIRRHLEENRQKVEIESRLKAQELQNLKMRTLLNETQLNALQAQINPHFMFNTLNAGMQLALFENAERTGTFLENLSETLRYSLGSFDKSSHLRDEIRNIDNYIYLLKVRFGEKINYDKDIDESLENVSIPRMVLQPIVENAFLHGIGEMQRGGFIRLRAVELGDAVRVEIIDNGAGMEATAVEALLSADYRSAPMEPGEGRGGRSIGLRNVISRLMLYYDVPKVQDILSIESSPGGGTTISLRLPKAREGS